MDISRIAQMGERVADEELVKSSRTQYDVSVGELIWRNFLAGSSRTMGSLFIYIIVAIFGSYVFFQALWPQIEPLVSGLTKMVNNLQNVPKFQLPSGFKFPGTNLTEGEKVLQ